MIPPLTNGEKTFSAAEIFQQFVLLFFKPFLKEQTLFQVCIIYAVFILVTV
jgi:hypothetical protein